MLIASSYQWLAVNCLLIVVLLIGHSEQYKSKVSIRNNRRLDEINLETCSDQDGSEYRLPRSVTPLHYNVTWRPDLEQLLFDGFVSILVRVNEPNATSITIHHVDLYVDQVEWVAANKVLKPTKSNYSKKLEAATYTFPEPFETSEGHLRLRFNGTLDDKLKGLYRSKYTRQDGSEAFMASTQFEPTDARRAFPCFDEPALKATFDVTVVTLRNLTALSNMPEVSRKEVPDKPGYDEISYATSPKMSTYLLAVVVGEYDYVEGKTKSGTVVRVYTPKGKAESGRFSLDVAIRSLDFFDDYFQQPFPLPKIDNVAIPDFGAGAMENWGLVTYRLTALLTDEKTSLAQKQQIALTVAHELAHQWFGNLVTMKWWTDLWLNEGFASFMMYHSCDRFFPEWNLWQKFVVDTYNPALNLDALDNSHPIEVPIDDPASISEVFDVISYRKGSSVLRMLNDWVGDEKFRDGLRVYLNRHKYGNTCTKDLWTALEERSGLPVAKVMSTWTKQKGFPLVTVTESQRSGDYSYLTLAQKKFSANATPAVLERRIRWEIPIKYLSENLSEQDPKEVFSDRFKPLTVAIKHREEWIKLNPKSVGFYRTQYPDELLNRLVPAIQSKNLDEVERLQLQSDLFALARAGYDDTVKFLKFVQAYKNETNYFVWDSISDSLGALETLLSNTDYQKKFHDYVVDLFSNVYETISWDEKANESPSEALMRSRVIGVLGAYGSAKVIEEGKRRFAEHNRAGGKQIPANLRGAIYQTVAGNSDDQEFEQFFEMYKKADSSAEKSRIGAAMGSTEKPEQIKRVLNFSLSADVRSQDAPSIITSVTGSLVGRELAWQFFQDNRNELRDRYANDYLIGRIVKGITSGFASTEKADEIQRFFGKNEFAGSQRAVQQALESIRLKSAWLAKDGDLIKAFLTLSKE